MSEVLRLPRLLCLLACCLSLTCAQRGAVDSSLAGPCAGAGTPNPQRPIVCVDDSAQALSVSPDPVEAHNVDKNGKGVQVQWFTKSGKGDLQIAWRDEQCVDRANCKGGHCTANVKAGAVGQRCKYDVQLTGHPTLDPDIIITACCSGSP